MELKHFIREALVQISEGVIEAAEALKEKGVMINPTIDYDGKVVKQKDGSFRALQQVEFTVGVTIESKEGSKTGMGVLTGLFSVGVADNQESTNTGINTLKFTIPISLPHSGNVTDHNWGFGPA